jgi:KaiC/GvpD/RAD55 family RecA-like ATPase
MSTVPFSRQKRYVPSDTEKPLPQNLDAERSVLGAILIDNSALAVAIERLVADDFLSDYNRRIFRAMLSLGEKAQAIDLVTLTDALHVAGELEAAGGAAYLAQLLDGVPHVTNVAHYAKIVKEKSTLRQLIHATHAIQSDAFDADESAGAILTRAIVSITTINAQQEKDGLKICDVRDFISMDLQPVRYVVEPVFPEQGIVMIHSWRGAGKTNFALEASYSVALGEPKLFHWPIPEGRPVVYVDGEMDAPSMQDRLRELAAGHKSKGLPPENQFRLITPDLQNGKQPNISTRDGQRRIEDFLTGRRELLVLDNISSLCPSDDESEIETWIMVQSWLLSLRRAGYTTVFLHHSGKGGTQRGWSGREDLINVTINLRTPANYEREDGLRAEVHIEKLRGKTVGVPVQPFEIQMQSVNGATLWTMRPLKAIIQKQAFEMFERREKDRDVMEVLRLSRYQVYRLRKQWEQSPKTPE